MLYFLKLVYIVIIQISIAALIYAAGKWVDDSFSSGYFTGVVVLSVLYLLDNVKFDFIKNKKTMK